MTGSDHEVSQRHPPLHTAGRLGLILMALFLSAGIVSAQITEESPYARAREATVFLMQVYDVGGEQILSCVGSGTLISSTGLILTSAHLAQSSGPCRGERVIVSLSVRMDDPPVPTYIAEPLQVNEYLDLAVMQIVGGLDGNPLNPASLNLPMVDIGDPSAVTPSTNAAFVGYPDTGPTSAVAIEGPITGISAETSGGQTAWLRTNATLGGGMSGGGAYDASGRLVGVLSSAPATNGTLPGPSCLSIQDSNHDGLISEQDACVPIGSPVTAVRPISHALALIEAARSGFRLQHTADQPQPAISGSPVISRVYLAQGVSESGIPSQIVSALPSGASALYVFFDYENMPAGIPYSLNVTTNSIPVAGLSLGTLAWGGGRKGTWYIGAENLTLPDGEYEIALVIGSQIAATSQFRVGGVVNEPSFSNLTFGIPDGFGGLAAAGTLFPAEIVQLDARFNFDEMSDGQDWTEVWSLDGVEVFRATHLWDKGPTGQAVVSAINYDGLPLGRYHLDLWIGQRLAAAGDAILAGNREAQYQPAAFSNVRMASEISRDGLPAGQTGGVMPLGVTNLYAFADWDFMPAGVVWTYRWFVDGRLVASSTQLWNAGGVGANFWVSLSSAKPLPEGTYAVEVLVENQPMFSATASVGSGTRPISGQALASEAVQITGTVIDALTGGGIPDAQIIVLDVALESPDFTWNQSEIYSMATTDAHGRFVLSQPLPRANFYTVYVFASGYITIIEDNFTVSGDQTSPVDIVIEMSSP